MNSGTRGPAASEPIAQTAKYCGPRTYADSRKFALDVPDVSESSHKIFQSRCDGGGFVNVRRVSGSLEPKPMNEFRSQVRRAFRRPFPKETLNKPCLYGAACSAMPMQAVEFGFPLSRPASGARS